MYHDGRNWARQGRDLGLGLGIWTLILNLLCIPGLSSGLLSFSRYSPRMWFFQLAAEMMDSKLHTNMSIPRPCFSAQGFFSTIRHRGRDHRGCVATRNAMPMRIFPLPDRPQLKHLAAPTAFSGLLHLLRTHVGMPSNTYVCLFMFAFFPLGGCQRLNISAATGTRARRAPRAPRASRAPAVQSGIFGLSAGA